MPRIQVQPDVQSATGLRPVWKPDTYRLRIKEVESTTSSNGKPMLRLVLETLDEIVDENDQNIGVQEVWDFIMVDPQPGARGGQISFLRPLVESAGLDWQDFDTEELEGKEVTARTNVGEYKGNKQTNVAAYIKG
jgi:hypothetical protein